MATRKSGAAAGTAEEAAGTTEAAPVAEESLEEGQLGKPQFEDRAEGDSDHVVYVGNGTVREITKQQWELAGIPNQDAVYWTITNEYKVPVDRFTRSALALLRLDKGFAVPEVAPEEE